MKLRIGFRTLKTAVGVSIAIMIAQFLQLDNFTSAGVLTLLCIQKSRRQSSKAVISRFIACLTCMFLASGLFWLIGYYPYSFLVLLILFIPLCVRFGIQEGIASSIVIVMHVYNHKTIEVSFFWNEFLVIIIGLGVALLVNWYMPSIDKELNRCREKVDELISVILKEIAAYLKEGYTLWDGKELLELSDALKEARSLVALEAENNMTRKESSFSSYFDKKRHQYDLLERMLPAISRISVQMDQSARLGDFIKELSSNLDNKGQTAEYRQTLRHIREYHKLLPLPATREEFENRASLYTMANELELFINTI